MKHDIFERVRNADPYPPSRPLPPIGMRPQSAPRANGEMLQLTTDAPTPKQTKGMKIGLAGIAGTVLIGIGSLIATTWPNGTPTGQSRVVTAGDRALFWPTYVPKGYCLARATLGEIASVHASPRLTLQKGRSRIAVTSLRRRVISARLVATEVSIGSVVGLLTHQDFLDRQSNNVVFLTWATASQTFVANGRNVTDAELVAAAKTVRVNQNRLEGNLRGFTRVDPSGFDAQRDFITFGPCATKSAKTQGHVLWIIQGSSEDPSFDPRGNETAMQIDRNNATDGTSSSSPDTDAVSVGWNEADRRVVITAPGGISRREMKRIIQGIALITEKQFVTNAAKGNSSIPIFPFGPSELSNAQLVAKTIDGQKLRSMPKNRSVCLDLGGDFGGRTGLGCFRPTSKPALQATVLGGPTTLFFAVAKASVVRGEEVFADQKTKPILSKLVPGMVSARVFYLERTDADRIPVAIRFYNSSKSLVSEQR